MVESPKRPFGWDGLRGSLCGFTLVVVLVACKEDSVAGIRTAGALASTGAVVSAVSDEKEDGGPPTDVRSDPANLVGRPGPLPVPEGTMAGDCPKRRSRRDRSVGIIISPRRPAVGDRVHILAASFEGDTPLALRVQDSEGREISVHSRVRIGAPHSTAATFVARSSGRFEVIVGRDRVGLACQARGVRRSPGDRESAVVELRPEHTWTTRRSWGAAQEALFSAWVRELFGGIDGEDLAWRRLSDVTSDPHRNFLHNSLGWNEDFGEHALELVPDCADAPYFLRAYFSWKQGLPFGFRKCSRGSSGKAPRCFALVTNEKPPDLHLAWMREELPETYDKLGVIQRFFARTVAWGVHTGNGRVALEDERSDFYPVRLGARGLRPGTIFADPYGHILVVTEFVAGGNGRPGILYAVDGQPDGSITRKRFWEGNFLWNQDPGLGGSGFKAFRPLVDPTSRFAPEQLSDAGTASVAMDDAGLRRSKHYPEWSMDQAKMSAHDFYDAVESIISPEVVDPAMAMAEAVMALAEASRVRATAVDHAVAWMNENSGRRIEMPSGHAIFETEGPWEKFSTPARDLRLLLAMDVVMNFGKKVRRRPAAYGLGSAHDVDAGVAILERDRDRLLRSTRASITYTRSDGSPWRVSLGELIQRGEALEMAYNPNDCPERRWAAPEDSDEISTCSYRRDAGQGAKMRAYRIWFARRRRPARGDPGPLVESVVGQSANPGTK